MSKRRTRNGLSVSDAMSLIDDDLPDGAYFAMLSELTGSDDVAGMLRAEVKPLGPPGRREKFCRGPGCQNLKPRDRDLCRACRRKAP